MPSKIIEKRTRSSTSTQTSAADAETTRKPRKRPPAVEEHVAVYGLYPDLVQTRSGVRALKKAGFPKTDISASSFGSVPVAAGRDTNITEREMRDEVADSLGVMARITGCELGLGAVPFLAPMLLAAPVLAAGLGAAEVFNGADRSILPAPDASVDAEETVLPTVNCRSLPAAKRATKTLQSTGARNLATSDLQLLADQDLKSREYRDEQGKVHHHTRTYMRDHAEQLTDTAYSVR